MKATQEIIEYLKNHNIKDTYLYNNRLLLSKFITNSQYNLNHTFISDHGL